MWIKFCGMTRKEDIDFAIEIKANAIGFIFAPSSRQIDCKKAVQLSENIREIAKVGVFVDEDINTIKQIRHQCNLDYIQLHGNETPEYCAALGSGVIKAFRVKDVTVLEQMSKYSSVEKYLLDAFVPGIAGGTGKQIDVEILSRLHNWEKIILAGGLTPDNISRILPYNPFGVDINSGVENKPGIKDHDKMKNIIMIIEQEMR